MESVCRAGSGLPRLLWLPWFAVAVGPGTRDLATEPQESARLLSPCPGILSAFCKQGGQVACEEQDSYGRRDRRPGLPRGPGGRAEKVSKLILGLLESLLGDLPGSVYFQNPFAVRFAVGLCN